VIRVAMKLLSVLALASCTVVSALPWSNVDAKCVDHPDCHPIDPRQCSMQANCCPKMCACCGQPSRGPYCDTAPPCGLTTNATSNFTVTVASDCDARSLISNHEGKRACVYIDTRGHPTVGIGYNLDNSGARQAIAAVGADYDKVRSGSQCLSDSQIMQLFAPSYQSAVSSAKRFVSSFDSLCCTVQEVMTDMSYNLGSLSGFNTFVSLINSGQWSAAAADGRQTAWCGQVGSRCSDDMGRVQQGCGGPSPTPPSPPTPTPPCPPTPPSPPSPPSPTPSSECQKCVLNAGGMACASRCEQCGSACVSCIRGGGGKACASRCC